MFKIDLHTHSAASADGGISAQQYDQALQKGLLHYIAVTDHGRIDFAQKLQASLGKHIIVGEEIMTTQGEIIGLFLKKVVPPGLTPQQTIKRIRGQDGLVYIPHPFETIRKGLQTQTMEKLIDHIDIVEICNGRALLQNRSQTAVVWAHLNHKPGAASSDAHGWRGLGKTYTIVQDEPTKDNLPKLLAGATPITDRPSLRSLLYPKINRLKNKLRREA